MKNCIESITSAGIQAFTTGNKFIEWAKNHKTIILLMVVTNKYG